ncbi:hypothetical protein [Ciceribacter sp. T2.26MG-112.2]|uniref:hypothetical protein n=1 Tax=Ciceribacter sp. T2.26MG-112.2 TaxID=3137154 RepID=UPI001E507443|nr:hypothetical protein [Ciceribacter naphthalenivorans]
MDFPGSVFRLPQAGIVSQANSAQDDDLLCARRSFRRYTALDPQGGPEIAAQRYQEVVFALRSRNNQPTIRFATR